MQNDQIVEKIEQVDLSGISLAIYAVFTDTIEYPGKCVARLFDRAKPTNIVLIRDTKEEMQEYFHKDTPLIYFEREEGNVPELVGTWI